MWTNLDIRVRPRFDVDLSVRLPGTSKVQMSSNFSRDANYIRNSKGNALSSLERVLIW